MYLHQKVGFCIYTSHLWVCLTVSYWQSSVFLFFVAKTRILAVAQALDCLFSAIKSWNPILNISSKRLLLKIPLLLEILKTYHPLFRSGAERPLLYTKTRIRAFQDYQVPRCPDAPLFG